MLCVLLAGFVSGGVWGCGVTSEVATTHPSTRVSASTAIESATVTEDSIRDGRPRLPRPAESTTPSARVAARGVAAPTATSAAEAAAARAVALGSPTRRIQSGRIVDEAGQPLVGATVLLQGTTRGTSTDANGDYSLPVPLGTNTFVFAYSGYEQEIAQSRDGQPLLITLLPDANRPPAASAPAGKLRPHKKQR